MGIVRWVMLAAVLLLGSWPFCPARAERIVVFGNDYKIPKIYTREGRPTGILPDILRWAEPKLGCEFDIQLYPWARSYLMAEQAQGGIIGLSKTQARLKVFDYSEPVYFDEVVLVVLVGREFPFYSINDLRGKRVGIGRGGSFGDEFEQARKEGLFIVDEDDGPVNRLRKLMAGRIDAALISPGPFALKSVVGQAEDLLENDDMFAILPVSFKRDPNYLGFAKGMNMRPFLERFNEVIRQGYESGEIQRILEKY